jgi:hypothetical protein
MKLVAAAIALVGAAPALAQEDARFAEGQARQRASEIRLRCSGLLSGLDGVTSVNVAGSGTDYRLILVVRDYVVKAAAREQLGGDAYDGLKVIWSVMSPGAAAFTPKPAAPVSSGTLASPLYESPTLKAAPAVAPSFTFAPSATPVAMPKAAAATPVTSVTETRRTFWAGPGTLTPPRRSRYSAYSSCMPSRHAIWVAQCTPSTTPTYGYSYPQGNMYRPAGSCTPQYGYGWSNWTPATYGYSRPGVAPSGGFGGSTGYSSYGGASYRPGLPCMTR